MRKSPRNLNFLMHKIVIQIRVLRIDPWIKVGSIRRIMHSIIVKIEAGRGMV